jgi:hypothetical protein
MKGSKLRKLNKPLNYAVSDINKLHGEIPHLMAFIYIYT